LANINCPADASGCRSLQVLNLKESTNICGPICVN
jgi:hypothetical protein